MGRQVREHRKRGAAARKGAPLPELLKALRHG